MGFGDSRRIFPRNSPLLWYHPRLYDPGRGTFDIEAWGECFSHRRARQWKDASIGQAYYGIGVYIHCIDTYYVSGILAYMRFPLFDLPIEWDEAKNRTLIRTRGVSFQEVLLAMEDERNILDMFTHPNVKAYPHQVMLVVKINNYACAVPFVQDEKKVFLKTIYKSRKLNRIYLSNK